MKHMRFLDTDRTVCMEPERLGKDFVVWDDRNPSGQSCRECLQLLTVHNEREYMREATIRENYPGPKPVPLRENYPGPKPVPLRSTIGPAAVGFVVLGLMALLFIGWFLVAVFNGR